MKSTGSGYVETGYKGRFGVWKALHVLGSSQIVITRGSSLDHLTRSWHMRFQYECTFGKERVFWTVFFCSVASME